MLAKQLPSIPVPAANRQQEATTPRLLRAAETVTEPSNALPPRRAVYTLLSGEHRWVAPSWGTPLGIVFSIMPQYEVDCGSEASSAAASRY